LKDPAISRRPSSRAAGVDRWQALEREQFLELVAAPACDTPAAAPAPNTPKEESRAW